MTVECVDGPVSPLQFDPHIKEVCPARVTPGYGIGQRDFDDPRFRHDHRVLRVKQGERPVAKRLEILELVEWKFRMLEQWNIKRLEQWNTGILEHHSVIPSFQDSSFRISNIPSLHFSNVPAPHNSNRHC
jgi:hypothetical protein